MSTLSPFARKVRLLSHEVGIAEQIEEINISVTPLSLGKEIAAANPLGKVPALMDNDGTWLYDSPVICEYLDDLHAGPRRIPARGDARWKVLRLQALADGAMEAAVLLRYETALRPQSMRWDEWSAGQEAKIRAALAALTRHIGDDGSALFDIGQISTVCALGYLDLRFPHLDWRVGHADLAAWYEVQCDRPSVRITCPPQATQA